MRQSLSRYWKDELGRNSVAPKRTLRLLVKKASGKRWDTIKQLVNAWERTEAPEGRALEKHLTSFIHREGLFRLATEILTEHDIPKGKSDPEKFRDRLDSLCFSFEQEQSRLLSYPKATHDYYRYINIGRVATGLSEIDLSLGGGLGKGELGLVIAPLGGGKTAVLVNFSAYAALLGLKVFYVTLEINRWAVMERLDMRIGGYTSDQLEENKRRISRCRSKLRKSKGIIHIQDMAHEELSPMRLVSLIERHSPVDLIVLDHADLMLDAIDRFELRRLYRQLRRVANLFEVPLWTASQSGRATIEAEDFGMGAISEDISKGQTCDAAVCLIQTPEEKARSIMRIKNVKTRRSYRNPTVIAKMDYSTMTLSETKEPRDVASRPEGGEEKDATQTDQEAGHGSRRKDQRPKGKKGVTVKRIHRRNE